MKNKKHSFKLTLSDAKVRRVFIISVAVILVLIAAVGTTLAFIATKTEGVKNVFDPVTITCEVQDDYTVKNTGDYAAYIRAYFVVNWVDSNDNVYGQPPVKGTDYTISVSTEEPGWFECSEDGFYYYKSPVQPSAATDELIAEAEIKAGVNAPQGYTLKVQMIAEAIQADPTSTVSEFWGVTVNNDKLISK